MATSVSIIYFAISVFRSPCRGSGFHQTTVHAKTSDLIQQLSARQDFMAKLALNPSMSCGH
uniref:Uncharacterized protein n=1 Tax=Arion vulgaris TaxID=1028688 RepID=A0A0B7APS8_9EUPU